MATFHSFRLFSHCSFDCGGISLKWKSSGHCVHSVFFLCSYGFFWRFHILGPAQTHQQAWYLDNQPAPERTRVPREDRPRWSRGRIRCHEKTEVPRTRILFTLLKAQKASLFTPLPNHHHIIFPSCHAITTFRPISTLLPHTKKMRHLQKERKKYSVKKKRWNKKDGPKKWKLRKKT